jgi:ribosomal protein L11 methyltransferase
LYLSGFYQEDLPIIDQACQDQGLMVVRTMTKNNWVAGIWGKP